MFPVRTCVLPSGQFIYGIHKPEYIVKNLRTSQYLTQLGKTPAGEIISNSRNFPGNDVPVRNASWVFEIPNPFPFMGTTYILKPSADRRRESANPFRDEQVSHRYEDSPLGPSDIEQSDITKPMKMALAETTKKPEILVRLAEEACIFLHDEHGRPEGLLYEDTKSRAPRPSITDRFLFEMVSNNPYLPDEYKQRMVLIPGAQGTSQIVGDIQNPETHIWEYLRANSYIPGGHYAANMAQDAVRYSIGSLKFEDITGLRHLYYQRIYIQLAEELGIFQETLRRALGAGELEGLRQALKLEVVKLLETGRNLPFNATIWGQNFGFDLAPSGYRLNASHQQVHQQYALVPPSVPAFAGSQELGTYIPTYTQGDLVAAFCREYRSTSNSPFFESYIKAIHNNTRLDGNSTDNQTLIIHEDGHLLVFVPKAQRSQGEIQIILKVSCGNILEADSRIRESIDRAIYLVLTTLDGLGAEMITCLEISKRFDNPDPDQRLIYCFLPKHRESPGGFSEAQQRWIIGHYPEDFAKTCRLESQSRRLSDSR